jgi:hypothetical protein
MSGGRCAGPPFFQKNGKKNTCLGGFEEFDQSLWNQKEVFFYICAASGALPAFLPKEIESYSMLGGFEKSEAFIKLRP